MKKKILLGGILAMVLSSAAMAGGYSNLSAEERAAMKAERKAAMQALSTQEERRDYAQKNFRQGNGSGHGSKHMRGRNR